MRDDIYSLIKDADKNKWRDYKIEIEWSAEKIKKLLAYRISQDADYNSPLNFQNAWKLIFANETITSGSSRTISNTFAYITRSTHLRPRDYIRYIQVCSEESNNRRNNKISDDTITFVDRAFSNYLRDEIVDEVYPLLPDIEGILKIISNLRKSTFGTEEFKKEYLNYSKTGIVTKENIDYVLDILFKFSVLGNKDKRRDLFYFKYAQPNSNLNKNEKLVVPRGLFKALQIL